MCKSLRIRKLYYSYISDNNERIENKNMFQKSENNDIIQQSVNKDIVQNSENSVTLYSSL